jgi:mannose-1-phosphate guanylyltransferase
MIRLFSPNELAPHDGAQVPASTQIVGNVLIAESATIGEGCKIGPDVVIG